MNETKAKNDDYLWGLFLHCRYDYWYMLRMFLLFTYSTATLSAH